MSHVHQLLLNDWIRESEKKSFRSSTWPLVVEQKALDFMPENINRLQWMIDAAVWSDGEHSIIEYCMDALGGDRQQKEELLQKDS